MEQEYVQIPDFFDFFIFFFFWGGDGGTVRPDIYLEVTG